MLRITEVKLSWAKDQPKKITVEFEVLVSQDKKKLVQLSHFVST